MAIKLSHCHCHQLIPQLNYERPTNYSGTPVHTPGKNGTALLFEKINMFENRLFACVNKTQILAKLSQKRFCYCSYINARNALMKALSINEVSFKRSKDTTLDSVAIFVRTQYTYTHSLNSSVGGIVCVYNHINIIWARRAYLDYTACLLPHHKYNIHAHE